jgi:hypothetical protein
MYRIARNNFSTYIAVAEIIPPTITAVTAIIPAITAFTLPIITIITAFTLSIIAITGAFTLLVSAGVLPISSAGFPCILPPGAILNFGIFLLASAVSAGSTPITGATLCRTPLICAILLRP